MPIAVCYVLSWIVFSIVFVRESYHLTRVQGLLATVWFLVSMIPVLFVGLTLMLMLLMSE